MNYYNRELLLKTMVKFLVWATRPKDPNDHLSESLNKRLAGDTKLKTIVDDQVNLICKLAMEDPNQRDKFVKFVKGLDPQSIEYSLLPEDVKDLHKD